MMQASERSRVNYRPKGGSFSRFGNFGNIWDFLGFLGIFLDFREYLRIFENIW